MSLTISSLQSIPTSYATCSIGYNDEHTLPKKLEAISSAGFSAIELSFPDILSFASLHLRHEVRAADYDDLFTAAKVIRAMCDAKGLKVLMLQPFANFEGWPEGSDAREDAFGRAKGWIRIMQACGAEILQVGSSDSSAEDIGSDRDRFVADLRQLADMLAEHGFRLAYENWCWSTHAPAWADVWDIVRRIDRPNVGLCLDTFQTAASEWGDPTTSSGLREDKPREELEEGFRQSLAELSRTIPKDRIYLLQISDAYKPKQPFGKDKDDSGMPPRARWSHDFRPLPFEGYLPVVEVTKAVLQTGFRGWFSYEVFDSGAEGKGKEYDLASFASNAMSSHKKLLESCATPE